MTVSQYATPLQPRASSKSTSRDGFKKGPKGDSGRISRDCCPICFLLDPFPSACSLPSALPKRKRTPLVTVFSAGAFSPSLSSSLSLLSHRPPGTSSSAKQSAQTPYHPRLSSKAHIINRNHFSAEIQEGRNARTRADRAFPGAPSASSPPSSVSIRLLLFYFFYRIDWDSGMFVFSLLYLILLFLCPWFCLSFLVPYSLSASHPHLSCSRSSACSATMTNTSGTTLRQPGLVWSVVASVSVGFVICSCCDDFQSNCIVD